MDIEYEPFDREYGIDDLLPLSMLGKLFQAGVGALLKPFLILRANGELFFSTETAGDQASFGMDWLEQSGRGDHGDHCDHCDGRLATAPDGFFFVAPLRHEAATIGFIVAGDQGCPLAPESLLAAGGFVKTVLNQLIQLTLRIAMTSDLHTEVVTSSYAGLLEKTMLLERSEKRYRDLAQSLERDVERKTREIEAGKVRLMHQEKLASLGRLAAGVAHEINNPIGFIKSNLNTLQGYLAALTHALTAFKAFVDGVGAHVGDWDQRATLDQKALILQQLWNDKDIDYLVQDCPQIIKESSNGADRIKTIVSDLSAYSLPGMENDQWLDLNSNLEATLKLLEKDIGSIDLTRLYGDIPLVRCKGREINQVFMNCFRNALEAMNGGGGLSVRTYGEDGRVVVCITDTGEGIAEEHLTNVFDPFFTTKPVGKGTGLGLSFAHTIVNQYRGVIEIKSKKGVGTSVFIKLPVNDKDSASLPPSTGGAHV